MDGKGWRPEHGISNEGLEILGFVEALPREVRQELLEAVRGRCRSEGFLSLHDTLRISRADGEPAKVIPLFKRR